MIENLSAVKMGFIPLVIGIGVCYYDSVGGQYTLQLQYFKQSKKSTGQ